MASAEGVLTLQNEPPEGDDVPSAEPPLECEVVRDIPIVPADQLHSYMGFPAHGDGPIGTAL
eukprot:12487830-Prorocentrum_lima.AAC.1